MSHPEYHIISLQGIRTKTSFSASRANIGSKDKDFNIFYVRVGNLEKRTLHVFKLDYSRIQVGLKSSLSWT